MRAYSHCGPGERPPGVHLKYHLEVDRGGADECEGGWGAGPGGGCDPRGTADDC